MRISLFILFICMTFGYRINAQNRKDVNVGPEFKAMMNELDTCVASGAGNCTRLTDRIIEKGKKEKVDFMDYLYFKKSYYFITLNELDSAVYYAQLAIKHPNPRESERCDLDAYNIIANCYYYQGTLDTAIKTYLKIAGMMEKGGDPLRLGYLYSNIATLLGETGNDNAQIEYLLKSYKLLEENNDQKFIATVASNLALGYHFKKDTAHVEEWAHKSLILADKSNDLVAKVQATLALSLVQRDLNQALVYAEQSKAYADLMNDKVRMASSYYRYAAVLHSLGMIQKALLYGEKAVEFATQSGDNVTLMKAAYTVADIAYTLGKKEKAADFYHTYALLKDSVASVENTREINEINTRYETEKKERQLAEQSLVIQQKNAQIRNWLIGGAALLLGLGLSLFQYRRSQQRKLKLIEQENENAVLKALMNGEERERNRISKDLHDGVAAMLGAAKMSLQSIPFLSEEKKMEQLEKTAQLVSNTHADVRRIAHDLLPVTLEKEGLIAAVAQFAADINATNILDFQVNNQLPAGFVFPKNMELMLYRIIQELINNVIRHSSASEAHITFRQTGTQLEIEVSDNGIGIGDNKEHQGLYSIRERLKALGGSFSIKGTERKGTRVQLLLELKEG